MVRAPVGGFSEVPATGCLAGRARNGLDRQRVVPKCPAGARPAVSINPNAENGRPVRFSPSHWLVTTGDLLDAAAAREGRLPPGLLDVVSTPDAFSQLSGGDGAANVGHLVGTGGVGAARTFELSAAADRPDSRGPALCLLNFVHRGHRP
jgi:hypothetical protein